MYYLFPTAVTALLCGLNNEEVKAFLKKGNTNLGILGYTDHSEKHCAIVAKRAGMILSKFGYSEHEIELAEVAGALHDIGNVVNRKSQCIETSYYTESAN